MAYNEQATQNFIEWHYELLEQDNISRLYDLVIKELMHDDTSKYAIVPCWLTKYLLDNGVDVLEFLTTIPRYSFENGVGVNFYGKELILPKHITSIETNAFREKCGFDKIVGEGVKTIHSNACSSTELSSSPAPGVKEFVFPNVESIDSRAFEDRDGIIVRIGDNLKTISRQAFDYSDVTLYCGKQSFEILKSNGLVGKRNINIIVE